ncbi:hypothetical protein GWI33_015059 [Rhynchophorus ferrugineus]|uniref:Uncharacterized protein n=1 Tax=Rhynchophorus ferrugineus TaxID=354439 RepID=A0A834MBS4_RHYFE|nr:hypothetical protein GWI33_015059 [Rhynchophorus ferrugineus]
MDCLDINIEFIVRASEFGGQNKKEHVTSEKKTSNSIRENTPSLFPFPNRETAAAKTADMAAGQIQKYSLFSTDIARNNAKNLLIKFRRDPLHKEGVEAAGSGYPRDLFLSVLTG